MTNEHSRSCRRLDNHDDDDSYSANPAKRPINALAYKRLPKIRLLSDYRRIQTTMAIVHDCVSTASCAPVIAHRGPFCKDAAKSDFGQHLNMLKRPNLTSVVEDTAFHF
ncbi:hypothetical protein EVAR_77899_1 [Eumeta japonica]|uniref:Uncharacterized protein n=1 Tax=Eumeta variegata TaxID=151549 RepID=A0A4C1ZGY9_EUMVA|nr:hypothetical protein EVAR_77899_1 [Eumeta japonica]